MNKVFMRYSFLLIFCIPVMFAGFAFCNRSTPVSGTNDNTTHNLNLSGGKMKIKIENSTFSATLYDNATAVAFKNLLPITLNMVELNGNEKYVDLPRNLTTVVFNPDTIQAGDIMLYGSSTLVLLYKTFSTSYSYTKLGKIDDTTALAAAVGPGNVTVTFELE